MEKLRLIIYREFIGKVRNKSFVILTFLSPFLIIGMGTLIFYLSKVNENSEKSIVIVDETNMHFANEFSSDANTKYVDLSVLGIDEAKKQIEKNNYYGVIYIPSNNSDWQKIANSVVFYSTEAPSIIFIESLEKKIENKLKTNKLASLGISQQTIQSAQFKVEIKQTSTKGVASSKLGNGLRIGMGMGAGYLVMMFIVIYGNSVMRSVIEEKTNRIIEIIISSVKPFQLMMGKIIGNASAGLLQFSIWGILLLVFSSLAAYFFQVDLTTAMKPPVAAIDGLPIEQINEATLFMKEIFDLPILEMFFLFLFYFIGGFFLYSSIYAAIGAAVDSETDTQQFMFPVLMPLMLGVYVGFASVISDPHGPIAVVFSIIPFTSSIVMLMRIPFGVPVWQLALSMVLLIASFVFMVWFAAKIYRIGILMYGKKPTYKDLYKWLKY